MTILIESKKEALLLLSLVRDSVSGYVTSNINKETTDSLTLEVPTLYDIAKIVVPNEYL